MKITVVGGGTAGFFTAAVLSKHFDVECIYSSKVGTIGVGESAQLSLNTILQYLDLEDSDWMSKCNATYKTNIGFESWSKKGEQFFYPFGESEINDDGFFDLLRSFPEEVKKEHYARYRLPHSRLAEFNRLTDEGWDFDRLTSYHFDSHSLSKIIFDYAKNNGVKFFDDEYVSCSMSSKGIDYITCKESGDHYADLFVDCTGFKSLLLKEMKSRFIPFSNTLINHRAITCKVPYTNKQEQLKNYTNNVTMNNGWCWEIPLWNSMSLGYVHSLRFATTEEIEKEFRDFVSERYSVDPQDIRAVDFTSGRYDHGWIKNVVAIGLSYSFIEPLEATGIYTCIAGIFKLLSVLSNESVNYLDRKIFNDFISQEVDKQSKFIEMHYASAHRNDTDYWNYVTNEIEYLPPMINEGLPYILAGNGYKLPYTTKITDRRWINYDREMNSSVQELKKTSEFLEDTIYSRGVT